MVDFYVTFSVSGEIVPYCHTSVIFALVVLMFVDNPYEFKKAKNLLRIL